MWRRDELMSFDIYTVWPGLSLLRVHEDRVQTCDPAISLTDMLDVLQVLEAAKMHYAAPRTLTHTKQVRRGTSNGWMSVSSPFRGSPGALLQYYAPATWRS